MFDSLYTDSLRLLKSLIAAPSPSRKEDLTARILEDFFAERRIETHRKGNNVWAYNRYWREGKPVLLLNSHHDTVRPAEGWRRTPYEPDLEGGLLYGLGSNDAGGALVALIAAFRHFYEGRDLPFNLILVASAEEEISGSGGIAAVLPELPEIWAGIVGEPTGMAIAVAEKGLMVIDGEARGIAGHAAREEGVNALYIALEDIRTLRNFSFEKTSPTLGPVKISVTQIQAGSQHNVVPDRCQFVVDVRTTDAYSNEEVHVRLQKAVQSTLNPRSFRLNSSGIPNTHPLVQAGLMLGLPTFGSPTLSDQALMRFPTVKIGPGDSARSHTAEEFIALQELEEGIEKYVALIENCGIIIEGKIESRG